MEGDEDVVVDEFLALLEHGSKYLLGAFADLDQVVVHGARLVEYERQRTCARRWRLRLSGDAVHDGGQH